MQKYFIHDGSKQLGPFSATELKARNVTRCTPVKTANLKNYVTASEIPELNELLQNGSPAIAAKTSSAFPGRLVWLLAIPVVIIAALTLYNLLHDVQDNPAAASTAAQVYGSHVNNTNAAKENEAANAGLFLTVHGKMHNNLTGKKIIKGSISNTAVNQGYKDVEVAVTFLSASQAELQTQRIFVNDSVNINRSISFRNVLKAPEETAGFRLKIISAIALQ